MNNRIFAVAFLMSTIGALGNLSWAADFNISHEATAQQAMERMKDELPQIRFQHEASRIARIYGQPLAVGSSASESADSFRLQRAAVFGVDAEDLRATGIRAGGPVGQPVMYDRSTGEYKFTLFRYAHEKSGIPVFRSELRLLVRNAADAPVVLASSSLRSLTDFAPDVAVVRAAVDPASLETGMEEFT